jgi:hypothetical protein
MFHLFQTYIVASAYVVSVFVSRRGKQAQVEAVHGRAGSEVGAGGSNVHAQ